MILAYGAVLLAPLISHRMATRILSSLCKVQYLPRSGLGNDATNPVPMYGSVTLASGAHPVTLLGNPDSCHYVLLLAVTSLKIFD